MRNVNKPSADAMTTPKEFWDDAGGLRFPYRREMGWGNSAILEEVARWGMETVREAGLAPRESPGQAIRLSTHSIALEMAWLVRYMDALVQHHAGDSELAPEELYSWDVLRQVREELAPLVRRLGEAAGEIRPDLLPVLPSLEEGNGEG